MLVSTARDVPDVVKWEPFCLWLIAWQEEIVEGFKKN